jgi:hypothetical protein
MKAGGWNWFPDALGGYRRHLIPFCDDRPHHASASCWCRPEQDTDKADDFWHNAADGREAFERGERRFS